MHLEMTSQDNQCESGSTLYNYCAMTHSAIDQKKLPQSYEYSFTAAHRKGYTDINPQLLGAPTVRPNQVQNKTLSFTRLYVISEGLMIGYQISN